MADIRLTLDDMIKNLRKEAEDRIEGLQQRATGLERELREVASAVSEGGALSAWDINGAELIHVFDVAVPISLEPGNQLNLTFNGNYGGHSILRRRVESGQYRAIVQLTKIVDEPRR